MRPPRVTRRVTFRNGQPGPPQRSSMRVPFAKSLALSARLTVREPAAPQRLLTRPLIAGKGTISVSQFSSTAVAGHLAGAGADRGIGVVAVLRAGRSVAVVVEVGRVGARAVLVDAVVGRVGGAGADPRVRVVAVGGPADAVAVGVAFDLLAGAAGVAVVADRGVVAGAAFDELGAAVAGDHVVVAHPALEDVVPAAAEQPVVACAAVEEDGQGHARR